jgi:AAA ATPase domain
VGDVREAGDETRERTIEPGVRFVGREAELRRLHEGLRKARQGERQLAFITGEAGIGKTALLEEFLRSPSVRSADLHVLQGQCIRQHGQREPYMPVLEALERVLRAAEGAPLIPLLRRMAPCWYVQIPWLLSDGEPAGLQGSMMSAPPERMLREIGAFLESWATSSTIVLVLEDLHWSDNATADLLSFLAQRRDPARLLILGTFRPVEASTHDHPIREIRQTLRARRRCVDLTLDYLSTAEVREYLHGRFGDEIPDLAPLIHQRTDGNPLFVVALVEELIRRGQLALTGGGWAMSVAAEDMQLAVPEDLLEMVTTQFENRTPDERSLLEAASVVGVTFSPSTVARALGRDPEDVEHVAQHLARAHLFLNIAGGAEERGLATRYEFTHALHHQAIYEQIPALRCQRLHLTIAEALESAAGERLAEIAPELSVHFERGGDPLRAAKYLSICAARAQQRLAPHEVIACAELALQLLERVPDAPERHQRELELRLLLGVSLHLTRGYSAPAVRANYERARALCASVGDESQLFEIMHAVWYAQIVGSKVDAAQETAHELARIAERQHAPEFRLRAEVALGRCEFWQGHFARAARRFTSFLEDVDRQPMEVGDQTYGVDPVVAAHGIGSLALWFLGHLDQAHARARDGIAYAEASRRPHSLASALVHATILESVCGHTEAAARYAARSAKVSADHAIANFGPMSRVFAGAARAVRGDVEGGLAEMLPALEEHRAVVGSHITDIMLALIAAAYGQARQWDAGLQQVDSGIALSEETLERVYAAELWRVKGELLLGKARTANRRNKAAIDSLVGATQQCFRRALKIARSQEARSLELRCAMSLTRLSGWRKGSHEAPALLRSLVASFTEGFDTKDLQDAQALLDSPEQRSRMT